MTKARTNSAAQDFFPEGVDQQIIQRSQQPSTSVMVKRPVNVRPKRRDAPIQLQHLFNLFLTTEIKAIRHQPSDSLLSKEVLSVMSKQAEITAALVT